MNLTGVACPTEPEKAACEEHTTDHADGQSPLRDGNVVVGFQLSHISRIVTYNDDESNDFTSNHTEVCKSADTSTPAIYSLEDKCVCGKKEVE